MTPQEKTSLKIIAILGGILILTIATILIVRKIRDTRAEREENEATEKEEAGSPPRSGSESSAMNTLNGRTFTKTEIEKMQSYLINLGAFKMNDLIVRSIRDTGGIDGKIGSGFKAAFAEAIRIGEITDLDDLYTQAMSY